MRLEEKITWSAIISSILVSESSAIYKSARQIYSSQCYSNGFDVER